MAISSLQDIESIKTLSLFDHLPDKNISLFFQDLNFRLFAKLPSVVRCLFWDITRPRDIHATICTESFNVFPRQKSIPVTYHINPESRYNKTRPKYIGKNRLDDGVYYGGFDPLIDTLCIDDVNNNAILWALRLRDKRGQYDLRPLDLLPGAPMYYDVDNVLLKDINGVHLIGFSTVRHLRVEQHGPYQRPSVPALNDKGQPRFSYLGFFSGLKTFTERLHLGSDEEEAEYKGQIENFFKAFKMLQREALARVEDGKGNEARARDIRGRAIEIPRVYFERPISGTIRF